MTARISTTVPRNVEFGAQRSEEDGVEKVMPDFEDETHGRCAGCFKSWSMHVRLWLFTPVILLGHDIPPCKHLGHYIQQHFGPIFAIESPHHTLNKHRRHFKVQGKGQNPPTPFGWQVSCLMAESKHISKA